MKNIFLVLPILGLFSLFTYAMEPACEDDEFFSVSSDEEKPLQDQGECQICQDLSTKSCASCPDVFYCGRSHQKQDWPTHKRVCPGRKGKRDAAKESQVPLWASAELRRYIEFCEKNPRLGCEGSPQDGYIRESLGLYTEFVEHIQVALGNKPISYNLNRPNLENPALRSLWEETLRFARERGVNIKYYTEKRGMEVIVMYSDGHEKNADYFIFHKVNPKLAGHSIQEIIMNGLFLEYDPIYIQFYCFLGLSIGKDPDGNEKYQQIFKSVLSEFLSISKGEPNQR